MPPNRNKYRWSPQDNRIAETELQMATIMTEELRSRPSVSLALVYASQKVRARIQPILTELERTTGRRLMAETQEEPRKSGEPRVVTVVIKDR